jgi:nucleotide-binding universal stress UspA family protein
LPAIVCAIRGGPDSQITIDRAVNLASEHALPLYFLYVVNLDFLSHTASSRVRTITQEMRQMGDFILLTAQEKALALGVGAQGVVRQGNVEEEIIAMCREVDADYVVLGQPKGQEEDDIFTHERILNLSQRIETESGAKVVIVEGEGEEDD